MKFANPADTALVRLSLPPTSGLTVAEGFRPEERAVTVRLHWFPDC